MNDTTQSAALAKVLVKTMYFTDPRRTVIFK